MKRQILSGLAALAFVSVALGRTDPAYINNIIRIFPSASYPAPPVIDATNFINNSAFIDNTLDALFIAPYATANTVYYTNFGVLGSVEGFRFDTFNTSTSRYTNAGSLHNEVGAIINCGGTNDGPYFSTNATFFVLNGGAQCLVWATNIVNRGTIEMGVDSTLSLSGQNVSLAGGLVNMEGFETGFPYELTLIPGPYGSYSGADHGYTGTFDGYWGLGQTPGYFPASSFSTISAFTPTVWVTNRTYLPMQTAMSLFPAAAYMNATTNATGTNGTDILWQVVYLQNANPSMSNNVYFVGSPIVEWLWPSTNIITGITSTNHLYLEDNMIGITNLTLTTNGVAPGNTGYRSTYIPTNYFFVQSGLFYFGLPATNGLLPGIFTPDKKISTEFTAYEAIFQPTTVLPGELAGQNFANMPGGIEVTATKQLDLRSSRIAGLNYLRLTATNNFIRDANTRILTAVADYNLGVTNSTLTVSNLLAPTCPRLNGFVSLFSTRWTNVAGPFTNPITSNVYNNTNTYFVTMVASQLSSTSPSFVQNLTLHGSNVVISDVLNVLSNITIDAYNLLITTNGPNSLTPAGQLNFPSGNPLDASAFPRPLRTLTNYGVISVQNAAFFGAPDQPLWDFVNHGSVLVQGCSIWATNFENTGLVEAGPGPINLTATTASLSNGVFNALFSDINLNADRLMISNQVLNAGHKLTIWATNALTDGGPASGNFWSAGVLGFDLPFEPPIASLLGTTITNTAPDWASVISQWAGRDLGAVPAGYSNNAALGRLILDGGLNSSFVLTGPAATNAMYVDYLEFRNYMTNFDGVGNLVNLQFNPGMKIYYAQLIINGVSWAEKLNGKNDGGLNWVPGYAGAFSSTNLVYPDGTTNRHNAALVQSCDLDSNCDGVPNCLDLAPLLAKQVGGFTAMLNQRTNVLLSWNGVPFRTNYLEFKSSLTAINWLPLTNVFVSGAQCTPQQVVAVITNTVPRRFYRVRVDALPR